MQEEHVKWETVMERLEVKDVEFEEPDGGGLVGSESPPNSKK